MRTLAWDGYFNVRDLGGLPTPLSATGATAYGRVARGPRREWMTAKGWMDARAWGLKSVVDLRSEGEAGRREHDPDVPHDAFGRVTITSAPTEDQGDPEFRRWCFPILDSPEYWRHNWRIQPELVRGALEAIAESEPGVLVHCSAGRDRTGMISTLLLGNAGVDPQVIADDYAASVRVMAGAAGHGPTSDRQATWSTVEVDDWLQTKVPIVRDAAAGVQAVLDGLGVGETTRARLRELLVV
ncbi:MAG: tyrosine-protein phosphatase [Humibacter sp.]